MFVSSTPAFRASPGGTSLTGWYLKGAREVPASFVGGVLCFPVLSYFIHILELLFASIALQTIFDAGSCTLKIIVGCSLHHEFSCEFKFPFLS